ncbi:hypothetical protein BD311DRAFT_191521 [Dichomitus squalens]|uniref:Uncharacterized protein n=1 Tax=Dichomitus squalens TaxID=114155 RepID=A0A4Q9M7R8_9APHY|nr:hypothetical protein BD311DRAFT_191521 [Dichomitus squalens]
MTPSALWRASLADCLRVCSIHRVISILPSCRARLRRSSSIRPTAPSGVAFAKFCPCRASRRRRSSPSSVSSPYLLALTMRPGNERAPRDRFQPPRHKNFRPRPPPSQSTKRRVQPPTAAFTKNEDRLTQPRKPPRLATSSVSLATITSANDVHK